MVGAATEKPLEPYVQPTLIVFLFLGCSEVFVAFSAWSKLTCCLSVTQQRASKHWRQRLCMIMLCCVLQIIPDDGMEVTAKKGVIEKLVGITSPAATT